MHQRKRKPECRSFLADRVAKRQPDWMSVVWEASGRAVQNLDRMASSFSSITLQEETSEAMKGGESDDDSVDDFSFDNDRQPMHQHMSLREKTEASVDGFYRTKFAQTLEKEVCFSSPWVDFAFCWCGTTC